MIIPSMNAESGIMVNSEVNDMEAQRTSKLRLYSEVLSITAVVDKMCSNQ